MNWKVPQIWKGGDVWILGGGPSVPKQFDIPENIIQDVIKGNSPPSSYSSYMSFLHDKHVIGINCSYLLGEWVDMVFFGDSNFYKSHQFGLSKFIGLKISCHKEFSCHPWIKYLSKDKRRYGISDISGAICWNGNSGAAAISVAANAGAKRIILLGFDMKLSPTHNQHWHDIYKRGQIKDNRRLPFKDHLRGFSDIARDAKRREIEILNCCPDSAIKEFSKTTMKELMKQYEKIPIEDLQETLNYA